MKTILYTTGTTGNPTPVFYGEKDWKGINKCAEEFREIYNGEQGIIYNFFPHSSNIGYWIVHQYAELTNSLVIELGMIKPEQAKELFKEFPPVYIAGLSMHLPSVLAEGKDFLGKLKHLIVSKGLNGKLEELKKLVPKECVITATYGTTEARKAWTTCANIESGYHVFDGGFKVGKGELTYKGIGTKDIGEVIEGTCPFCKRDCQRIMLDIKRMSENKTSETVCGVKLSLEEK